MKILFTGASSFTGFWFLRELAKAGHEVIACFCKSPYEYIGIRNERVKKNLSLCLPIFNCAFGSESFLNLINIQKNIDVFCHHGAEVTNYKDPDFDILQAVSNNTRNIKTTLRALKFQGCDKIILTGSVFEPNEGQGSDNLRAVSSYGLSKGLTSEVFRFFCEFFRLGLGKFVIANPFGPYEEQRFTNYLIKTWSLKERAIINTPEYVRDNIHVSLLAKAYKFFVENLVGAPGFSKFSPSGYVETQRAFVCRFTKEMRRRLGWKCEYECKIQTEFVEPKIRVNTDTVNYQRLGWNEKKAWDDLAHYYAKLQ